MSAFDPKRTWRPWQSRMEPDQIRYPGLDDATGNPQSSSAFRLKDQWRGVENMAIQLKVNGKTQTVTAEPDTPLLYVLRNDFELNGAKFGCGLAQCGACTVLVDGKATRSCVTPIGRLGESEVTTIEGL